MTVSGAAALPDGVTLRAGFTGKEDQTPDFGIGYTDFGARLYSPASRRWMVPDPLSEKYYGISPYAYCNNNPVNFVDPDGRDIWEIDMTGRILNRKKDETQDVFHIVNQGIETTNTTLSFGYHTFSEIDGIFSSVNGKMSLDLFCFLSSNTSVEYGLIATDESLYSIFTDHHHDRIDITTVGNVLQKSGHTINTMIHSHPENKYPSGYGNQCIGDRLVTVLFDDPFTKQIDHFVYYPKYNSVMQFDKNGIIDFVVPMETAFPHFF